MIDVQFLFGILEAAINGAIQERWSLTESALQDRELLLSPSIIV